MPIILKTQLYAHQKNELKFHLARDRSASWDEMGVGKTLITLAKLRILYNQSVIHRILVICPLSVLETWATEIAKHTTFTYTKLQGSLEHKIQLLAGSNTPIFLLSYDSIPGRKRTLGVLFWALLQKRFDFIVCDEVTHIKNFNAERTKAVTALSNIVGRTLFLSGTPITNNPDQVLTIYNAMDGGDTFRGNFFASRNKFFENTGGMFPHWILREECAEEFKKALFKNATRLLKSECLQLPPKIFTERYTDLSGTQREIYHKVSKELLKILTLPEGKVKIQNSLVKMAKLSQLSSGFVYTDKKPQLFSPNPKLELLKEILEEIPKDDKIVIYVRWIQDLESIKAMLDSIGMRCVILSGSTTNRQTPIQSFLNEPNVRILLSQMTAGAYGLTLTVSHTVIYYSLGFSSIEFQQSQDRIHRIGQKFPCVYVFLMCNSTIDKYIYSSLKQNIDVASSLLNSVSAERLKRNLEEVINKNYE